MVKNHKMFAAPVSCRYDHIRFIKVAEKYSIENLNRKNRKVKKLIITGHSELQEIPGSSTTFLSCYSGAGYMIECFLLMILKPENRKNDLV